MQIAPSTTRPTLITWPTGATEWRCADIILSRNKVLGWYALHTDLLLRMEADAVQHGEEDVSRQSAAVARAGAVPSDADQLRPHFPARAVAIS